MEQPAGQSKPSVLSYAGAWLNGGAGEILQELRPEKCPACGYLLEGLPEPIWCPECGLEVGDDVILPVWNYERKVMRPYPVWRWWAVFMGIAAGIAVLAVIAGDHGLGAVGIVIAVGSFAAMLIGTVTAFGIWRAMSERPTHSLWLSRRGYVLRCGRDRDNLRGWVKGSKVSLSEMAAEQFVLRVILTGDEGLVVLVASFRATAEAVRELERRMEGWMPGRVEGISGDYV